VCERGGSREGVGGVLVCEGGNCLSKGRKFVRVCLVLHGPISILSGWGLGVGGAHVRRESAAVAVRCMETYEQC
jgi:hypothetical protein